MILLSVAADELQIGHERLRQLAAAGEIRAERRGKLWFLRESEIASLKRRGRLKPGPTKGRRPRKQPIPPHAGG